MKRFALILAAASITVCVHAAGVDWETNYDTALEKAKKDRKLVMVYVYTDWCPWCKRFDKTTYPDKTVQEALAKNFVPLRINPEKSKKNTELAIQFGTRGYPHLLVLDNNGKKINELGGYLPADEFARRLDETLKKSGGK
jgi:thioredoxin-related protein